MKAAAEILGLTPLLERYPRQLSGGQRQRVAMGRSIVRNPQVFLFDEPLSNLDAKLRVSMRAEIKALHRRLGTTTVYVTHDQVEAMTLADRIVVMQAGRVEQAGAPIELYDRPENTFVAQFIGSPSMNILPGRRQGKRHRTRQRRYDRRFPPPTGLEEGRRPVLVGKRPENHPPHGHRRSASPPSRWSNRRDLRPTRCSMSAARKWSGCFRDRVALREQQAVRLSFDDGPLHLFDAETKRRLPE